MSKGALIFAFNGSFDYVTLATIAAKQIQKHLQIPVSLVTDQAINSDVFDKVIVIDTPELQRRVFSDGKTNDNIVWFNDGRYSAYDLTPYDQTLLLDADYLIFSDTLARLFDANLEFACYDKVFDITNQNKVQEVTRLAPISIPMQWATVIYFTKCALAKNIFEMMSHVKNNYKYYSEVFHFNGNLYRNDYSLSIALQTLTGYNTKNFTPIPGKLFTADPSVTLHKIDINTGEIVYSTHNKLCKINGIDIHIMNKRDILTKTQYA